MFRVKFLYGLLSLSVCIKNSTTHVPLMIYNETNQESLAKCLGKITEMYAKEVLLLVHPKLDSTNCTFTSLSTCFLLKELFQHTTVIVRQIDEEIQDLHYYKKITNYIIFLENPTDLTENLFVLNSSITWNPRAKFVIYIARTEEYPIEAISVIFKQLWDNTISDAVAIILDKSNSNFLYEIYTWYPFHGSNCGDNITVEKIDCCYNGNINYPQKWFNNKIPNNLNGCTFKVQVIVWPPYVLPAKNGTFNNGHEVLLLNTVAKSANFTPIYSVSSKLQEWGVIYDNGTNTGAAGLLYERKIDMTIGGFAALYTRVRALDTVCSSNVDSFMWCVPHATDATQWKKFVYIMDANTWSVLIFLYCIISFLMWIIGNFKAEESNLYKSLPNCMQNAFGALVAMAVTVQPKSFSLRLIFLTLVFFSLYASAIYQTFLISNLTKPRYEQKIKSSQDIYDNNMIVWFLPNLKEYFKDTSDPVSVKVLDHWGNCDDLYSCMKRTALMKDSAVCVPYRYMTYIMRYFFTSQQEPLLYCFDEGLLTYPKVMHLQKNSFLTKRINSLVGRVHSAGLIAYWEKNIIQQKSADLEIKIEQSGNENQHQIRFRNLKVLFVILLIGYAVSTLVFLIEVFYRYFFK